MKLYKISSINFYPFSEDGENKELNEAGHDDWAALEMAEDAFTQSKINPNGKKVSRMIEVNGEIVGAIYSSLNQEDDGWRYSFDVAIHPQRRAKQGVGLGDRTIIKVLDEAMAEFERYKNELGDVYCYVWAVNPKIANILESRYGFDRENYSEDGQATLIKY